MRWIACSAVLFLAACHLGTGEAADAADPFDEAEHLARMAEVTENLIQSSDPTQQAAGLLMAEHALLWSPHEVEPALSAAESIDRLHALIGTADTAIARALLAQLCAGKGIQEDCIRRGLDEAIVRFDNADLIARLHLTHHEDGNRVSRIIIEAQALEERHMDYALLLLDAMEAHGGFVAAELAVAPILHGLSLSPPFAGFARLCASPSPEDMALDQACKRMLEKMMQDRSSLMLSSIGSAVSAQRRQAEGDPDALERHEQWRSELNERLTCLGAASDAAWEAADAKFVRDFLNHWQQYGEASAQAMVADKSGVDCQTPDAARLSNG